MTNLETSAAAAAVEPAVGTATAPEPACLDGARILVTGGTGSFGRAFVATVLRQWSPAKLIVYSRDEMKQYDMEQMFPVERYDCMRYFIGDVRDVSRLEMAFRDVDYVVHAAALKHVPIAEYNPFECIHTNVLGAENVVRAALRAGVRRVIALSTDKAANPINLYGASKLASDKVFVASNNLAGKQDTRFAVVRYGNVLGSRGSVIPMFRRMLAEGAHCLPITDERMTRFWITLQQGIAFVLSSFSVMTGGEIFVPKIPSMRLVDLVKAIAPDATTRVIGIRPGEKLHEVMITTDDSRMTLDYDDRYVIKPPFERWQPHPALGDEGRPVANGFSYASDTNTEWLSIEELRALLGDLPPS